MAVFVFAFWAVVILGGLLAAIYLFLGIGAIIEKFQNPRKPSPTAAFLQEQFAEVAQGVINPALICPHCQTKGQVRTLSIKEKKGVSGGKATGALLTGGISLLATGLSRKENATRGSCGSCRSTWTF